MRKTNQQMWRKEMNWWNHRQTLPPKQPTTIHSTISIPPQPIIDDIKFYIPACRYPSLQVLDILSCYQVLHEVFSQSTGHRDLIGYWGITIVIIGSL